MDASRSSATMGEELTCEIRQFGASDGVARLRQETPRALRQNNAILTKKSPHMIDKSCPGADDAVTRAVKRVKILLFGRFDRHEPHCWARGGFVNSFGIRRVVLGSFDKRLHEAWIDQQNPAAASSEKAPAPIVRAGARLHRDRLWSQLLMTPSLSMP